MNVNTTSIHFGQLNTSAEGNGYSIYLRLHLSILKTLLASFDEEVFCFAVVLLRCLRHAVFARYIRDVNLTSAHFVLAETFVSSLSARTSRWPTHRFSTVNICVMYAYVCVCISVLRPPDNCQFAPFDKFRHFHLLPRGKALDSRPCAFSPTRSKKLK